MAVNMDSETHSIWKHRIGNMKGLHIVLIGNPGAGKSTLLNSLVGDAKFSSGISFGEGLTKNLGRYSLNGITYLDTPGLADDQLRQEAAEAITQAMQEGGDFKVFFICTLHQGRPQADDKSTMRLVLKALDGACKKVQYGVIFNQVSDRVCDSMMKNNGSIEKVSAQINSDLAVKTPFVHFERLHKDLDGAENSLMQVSRELMDFITMVPTVDIDGPKVAAVDHTAFEAERKEMQKVLRELQEDKEMMERAMKKDKEEMKKAFEEHQERVQAQHEAEMKTLTNLKKAQDVQMAEMEMRGKRQEEVLAKNEMLRKKQEEEHKKEIEQSDEKRKQSEEKWEKQFAEQKQEQKAFEEISKRERERLEQERKEHEEMFRKTQEETRVEQEKALAKQEEESKDRVRRMEQQMKEQNQSFEAQKEKLWKCQEEERERNERLRESQQQKLEEQKEMFLKLQEEERERNERLRKEEQKKAQEKQEREDMLRKKREEEMEQKRQKEEIAKLQREIAERAEVERQQKVQIEEAAKEERKQRVIRERLAETHCTMCGGQGWNVDKLGAFLSLGIAAAAGWPFDSYRENGNRCYKCTNEERPFTF